MTAAETAQQDNSTQADPLVLLVIPPFQGLRCPGLGVSQLKANLEKAGFRSEVLYLNLKFAERIGPRAHEWCAKTGPWLTGEFAFSFAVRERDDSDVEKYLDQILKGSGLEPELEKFFPGKDQAESLRYLIGQAREFIQSEAIDEILKRDPWMVGMSSTFQSNCCGLALTQEIKKRRPEVLTVMGGANTESDQGVELIKHYPAIDFIGRGECDKTFIELVKTLHAGKPADKVDGFLAQGAEEVMPASVPLMGPDLDENPYPDFVDYFQQFETVGYRKELYPGLTLETSRGCWWGAKSHCTFCAFNRDGMVFRSKNPERAITEIRDQIAKYGISRVEVTDNILDMGYYKNVVRDLAEDPVAEFFWETKSNLSREQVRIGARAGLRWLQPGIESLSDNTLKLMRKGATGMQNIQLLKWCTESGVRITWNWLFGFPGEDESELDDLAKTAEAIQHLEPPSSSAVLFLERSSPYFNTPDEWGLNPIRPAKAYSHVYPFDNETLLRMAFFFEADHFDKKCEGQAHKKLLKIVADWNGAHSHSHLMAVPRKNSTILLDTRKCRQRFWTRLTGLRRKVYDYCWKIRGLRDVQKAFEDEAKPEEIAAILKGFVDDRFMLGANDRYLSVATDPRVGYRDWVQEFPGGGFVEHPPQRKGVRKLAESVLAKMPPWVVVRGHGKRLGRLKITMRNQLVAVLSKMLSQSAPALAPKTPPEEPPKPVATERQDVARTGA